MTPDEKRALRIDSWCNPGIQFADSLAESDYKGRVGRLLAAISLRKPDRVPVRLNTGFLPASSAGLTTREAMSDYARAAQAWVHFNLKFQPDALSSAANYTIPSSMLEALDYKLYLWPGHGVADNASYQFSEKEWMLPEEYDHLISDPSDYMLRTYLPRTVGAFAGFAGLSSLFDFIELPCTSSHVGAWDSPAMLSGVEQLVRAARQRNKWWTKYARPAMDRLRALGFPAYTASMTKAPFDILGDTLRGTRGVTVDLFRRPDKVLAACERLVPVAVDWALRRPGTPETPLVSLPLHKGADGFMSDEQFRTFYWPSLRSVILRLVDEGMIPLLFAEGRYDSRLETIMDLPKARTVWLFDQTDMARAKQTVGTLACIQGNMPLTLLHAGTPKQVEEYTRKLIDTAGEGGGFVLDVGAVPDEAKAENLAAMVNTAREYGVY